MPQRLILASRSPQRSALLAGLGVTFDVIASDREESTETEKDPALRAVHLAKVKAMDVATRHIGAFVIGCDTLVVSCGMLLEKPTDEADARRMITLQSGNTSTVHSAVCVISPGGDIHEALQSSAVTFSELSESEIDWWISTECWRDRSGAFQIDGKGQLLISHTEGDWTGIVGLPVFTLGKLLDAAGFQSVRV